MIHKMLTFAIAMAVLRHCSVAASNSSAVNVMHFPVFKCSEFKACADAAAADECTFYVDPIDNVNHDGYHCCGNSDTHMCMNLDMFTQKIAWLTNWENYDTGLVDNAGLYDSTAKERINFVIQYTSVTAQNYPAVDFHNQLVKGLQSFEANRASSEQDADDDQVNSASVGNDWSFHGDDQVNSASVGNDWSFLDQEANNFVEPDPIIEPIIVPMDEEKISTTHHTKPSATPTVDFVIAASLAVVLLVVVGAYITHTYTRSRSRGNENNNNSHNHSQFSANSEAPDEL